MIASAYQHSINNWTIPILATTETTLDRGITTASNKINKTSEGLSLGKVLSLDKMRYHSLYWDKIISPVYFMNVDELSD